MAVITLKKVKKNNVTNKVVVSSKVKDYGNHPFFVKKAKEAEAFLRKYGFPKT